MSIQYVRFGCPLLVLLLLTNVVCFIGGRIDQSIAQLSFVFILMFISFVWFLILFWAKILYCGECVRKKSIIWAVSTVIVCFHARNISICFFVFIINSWEWKWHIGHVHQMHFFFTCRLILRRKYETHVWKRENDYIWDRPTWPKHPTHDTMMTPDHEISDQNQRFNNLRRMWICRYKRENWRKLNKLCAFIILFNIKICCL